MKRVLPWIAPLALVPIALAGLAMWQSQATPIWLAGFIAACF